MKSSNKFFISIRKPANKSLAEQEEVFFASTTNIKPSEELKDLLESIAQQLNEECFISEIDLEKEFRNAIAKTKVLGNPQLEKLFSIVFRKLEVLLFDRNFFSEKLQSSKLDWEKILPSLFYKRKLLLELERKYETLLGRYEALEKEHIAAKKRLQKYLEENINPKTKK